MTKIDEEVGQPIKVSYDQKKRELLISSQDEDGRPVELQFSPQMTRSLYELLKAAERVNGTVGDEVSILVDDQRKLQ